MMRSLVLEDFEQWKEVRGANQDWLLPWEPTRNTDNYDSSVHKGAFLSRCEAWSLERENGRGHQFGVFLAGHEERLIGELNVSSIQRGVFQNCSLGYWVDRRHAGNSYTPEAVVMAFRYAFEGLNLHRVQIAIVPRNASSLRVVKKLKLRKEGLSERYLEINGKWENHYIFAITLEEYEERKDALFGEWLAPI